MKKIFSKKGSGMVLFFVIILIFVFPVMMCSIIDLSNTHKISKDLKRALNVSVKAAALQVDEDLVPDGIFRIDEAKATNVFKDMVNKNLGIDSEFNGRNYEYELENGNKIKYYISIYNQYGEEDEVLYPSVGSIPEEVTEKIIQIKVEKPTVFCVIAAEYKPSILFGSRTVDVLQIASSQLNYIPQHLQKSNDRALD